MRSCKRPRVLVLAAAMLSAGGLAAPGAVAQQRNCIDVLAGMSEFSRFTTGIVNTHLTNQIRNANQITIFAPTNDAVNKLNQILIDRLFPSDSSGTRTADPILAPAAVGAHIVQGKHTSQELAQGATFTTVTGAPLRVQASGGTVTVQGAGNTQAQVTRADIPCSNGVIHAIGSALLR